MKTLQEKYFELCRNHEDWKYLANTTLGNLNKEQYDKIEEAYSQMNKKEEEITPVGGDNFPLVEKEEDEEISSSDSE